MSDGDIARRPTLEVTKTTNAFGARRRTPRERLCEPKRPVGGIGLRRNGTTHQHRAGIDLSAPCEPLPVVVQYLSVIASAREYARQPWHRVAPTTHTTQHLCTFTQRCGVRRID